MELSKSVDHEKGVETKPAEFVDLEKGAETKPTKFIDLEKGPEINGSETTQEDTATKNQTLVNVITRLSQIVMVMILALYFVLVTFCFKNMAVWAAIGTTIYITPAYLLFLKAIPYLRDVYIEKVAIMYPAAGRDGSNLPSENV